MLIHLRVFYVLRLFTKITYEALWKKAEYQQLLWLQAEKETCMHRSDIEIDYKISSQNWHSLEAPEASV